MPQSNKGHKFIFCIIDKVTNYLNTVPIYQSKADALILLLLLSYPCQDISDHIEVPYFLFYLC